LSHCYSCLMPPRIDPRVERTRRAVLRAAALLLRSEGPDAVTHARVAEVARVGRATVYRHWPEQGDLLHDAVASKADNLRVPSPDLSSRERVTVVLEHLRRRLNNDDVAVQFATLIGRATWDPMLRQALLQMSGRGQAIIDGVLGDAIDRGELRANTDIEAVRDGLIGALFVRRFLSDQPLNRAYLDRIVANALDCG
jgi:TetR/AcrR family transcriptional regulator, regulator of autoinduction and epiphytic fitness